MSSDDKMDVPVQEWCSASDAVLWIMLKRPPVHFQHMGLLPGTAFDLSPEGLAREMQIREHADYRPSWNKLYQATKLGKVRLRGRLAIGPRRLVPGLLRGYSIQCEKWDEPKDIAPAILKDAGLFAFDSVEHSRFFANPPVTPMLYVSDGNVLLTTDHYPPGATASLGARPWGAGDGLSGGSPPHQANKMIYA